jgi:hypothetical protein
VRNIQAAVVLPVPDLITVSPPHVVGYANGIAQSIVSLARFCGPVLGGLVRVIFVVFSE